ncbi:GDCCVxC domain-containing (seleno)protein [Cyclobacterium xiamenense]
MARLGKLLVRMPFVKKNRCTLLCFGSEIGPKTRGKKGMNIQRQTIIRCPVCGHQKAETMPTDACVYFYACNNCSNVVKPKPGDCCVYCSYATVKCPPVQADTNCCNRT